MQLTPIERRQYYERAITQYQPKSKPSNPSQAYSCNLLFKFLSKNYPQFLEDPRPVRDIIAEQFPEYHDILFERRGNIFVDIKLIKAWPTDAEGNAARVSALSEAIKRVSLLINQTHETTY